MSNSIKDEFDKVSIYKFVYWCYNIKKVAVRMDV